MTLFIYIFLSLVFNGIALFTFLVDYNEDIYEYSFLHVVLKIYYYLRTIAATMLFNVALWEILNC